MIASHRSLPAHHRSPLPPQQIVEDVADGAGVEQHLKTSRKQPLVWTAHYAYGALMGAAYGGVTGRKPGNPLARGICFGLGVWAADYLVGLPVASMRASAHREPASHNTMMILSHVVWVGTLGIVYSSLLFHCGRRSGSDE